MNQLREPVQRAIVGLRNIALKVTLPKSIAEKLYTKTQNLNDAGIPSFDIFFGLVKALPQRLDEIVLAMKMGLVSDHADLAQNAALGLHLWLRASSKEDFQIHPPPDDLIREIGVIIATRREESLPQALQVAKWVFDEGKEGQIEVLSQLALQGLEYLAEELRYDRDHEEHDDDVPLLRWRSAQLAVSISKNGFENHPAVVRWIQMIQNDPLPEVRYTEDSPFVHPPANVSEGDSALSSSEK